MLWGAPTYDQVRIAYDMIRRANVAEDMTQVRMQADFASGGMIIFRSLDDPDNARGHSADGAVFDEVGYIKDRAYYEIVGPMLAERDDTFFWGLGTPNGRNWFWREFVGSFDRDDSMAWQIPVKGSRVENGKLVRDRHELENPDIPFGEIERLFETMTERQFRQEVLAEFLENEGQVFRNIAEHTNAPANEHPDQHRDHRIVAGVDWGKHNDFTVFCYGCATCRQELVLYRSNNIEYRHQRQRLEALDDRWNASRLEVELNAMGEPLFEELDIQGKSGFTTTSSSKQPLIEGLALAFEQEHEDGGWQFLDNDVATAELEAFERQVNPNTNRAKYGAPEGMHDDTVIARALMVYAAQQRIGDFVW